MNAECFNELQKSKEYREAYVAAHVRNGIAFQLRTMRGARGWDQKELASRLGNVKLQPVVSRYENPDYGRYSISTLLELADVYDVALVVRFAPFNEVVEWESKISEANLNVPSFDDELKSLAQKKNDFGLSILTATWAPPYSHYATTFFPFQTTAIGSTGLQTTLSNMELPILPLAPSTGGAGLWNQK